MEKAFSITPNYFKFTSHINIFRLFELGFQEQLSEILRRLPQDRQTMLFSATLPRQLVEFAKAGLNDPTLVRLDVDTKLSNQLKVSWRRKLFYEECCHR